MTLAKVGLNRPPDEYEPLMDEGETLRGTVRASSNLLEFLMAVLLEESTPYIVICTI